MKGIPKISRVKNLNYVSMDKLRSMYAELLIFVTSVEKQELIYCHGCNSFRPSDKFLTWKGYESGYYPECRDCLRAQATDLDRDNGVYVDNRTKTIEVFRKLNIPFSDTIYEKALENPGRGTAYDAVLSATLTMPQFSKLSYRDSEFREFGHLNPTEESVIEEGTKRFGAGFTKEDYEFLINEYNDWVSKYECDTKSQESIFERLTFKKWEIMKATRAGKATDNLDKSFQSLLNTGNLTPKQAQESGLDTSHTFGELIKKWEDTRPLPEVDPDLEDVDKIGYYFNIFLGHTSKMVGLKNAFSNVYERFIKKFTVNRPKSDSDDDTEAIFDRIFGNDITNE